MIRRQAFKVPEHYDPDCMIVWIFKAQSQPNNNKEYYLEHREEILAKQAAKRAIKCN